METTGALSVYEKSANRSVEKADVGAAGKDENPPVLVVQDGTLIPEALKRSAINEGKLNSIIAKEKIKIKDIFILSIKSNGEYILIKKEK